PARTEREEASLLRDPDALLARGGREAARSRSDRRAPARREVALQETQARARALLERPPLAVFGPGRERAHGSGRPRERQHRSVGTQERELAVRAADEQDSLPRGERATRGERAEERAAPLAHAPPQERLAGRVAGHLTLEDERVAARAGAQGDDLRELRHLEGRSVACEVEQPSRPRSLRVQSGRDPEAARLRGEEARRGEREALE